MPLINIGDAAAAAGVTPKMVRHYESLGLIPEAERTEAGYRLYGEREVSMLRFIRQARGLGFSMQQIEQLMSLWRDPARHSQDVKQVARSQLQELQARQRELDQMRATLEQLVDRCRGDGSAHCVILDRLASGAGPQADAREPGARRALKEVRPGEKRAATRRGMRARADTPAAAHTALAAWMHTFSAPPAAA